MPPAAPSGITLPMDAVERLPIALSHLDGWVESVLALLRYAILPHNGQRIKLIDRYPTSRPVPVPIAQIVAAGLRCLNLTLDTPVSHNAQLCGNEADQADIAIYLTSTSCLVDLVSAYYLGSWPSASSGGG